MKDFSLEHSSIKKVYLIIFLILCFSCKEKKLDNIKKKGLESFIQKNDIEKLKPITNDILNKKIITFINKNPLDDKYKFGEIYLISFSLKNKDTLLIINKTFMPVLISDEIEYKGGFNYGNLPILIIDFKESLGGNYYDNKYLNDSLVKKLKYIEHPTSFLRLMKTEKYLIKNGSFEKDI